MAACDGERGLALVVAPSDPSVHRVSNAKVSRATGDGRSDPLNLAGSPGSNVDPASLAPRRLLRARRTAAVLLARPSAYDVRSSNLVIAYRSLWFQPASGTYAYVRKKRGPIRRSAHSKSGAEICISLLRYQRVTTSREEQPAELPAELPAEPLLPATEALPNLDAHALFSHTDPHHTVDGSFLALGSSINEEVRAATWKQTPRRSVMN